MSDQQTPLPLPANITLLHRLVTTLLAVMIIGFIVLIAALISQLNTKPTLDVGDLSLPAGVNAVSYSYGGDWQVIVGDDNRLYIFDNAGTLKRVVHLEGG